MAVTDDTCIPVLETIYEGDLVKNDKQPYDTLARIQYQDMTTGIASAKVFEPPDYCKSNSTDVDIDYDFQWHRFMYV